MIGIVKVSSAKINGFSFHMFYFAYNKKAFIPYFIIIKDLAKESNVSSSSCSTVLFIYVSVIRQPRTTVQ